MPECAVGFAGFLTKHLCDLLKNMGDHRGVVRRNGAPEGLNEKRGVAASKIRHNYPCWKYVDIPRLNPLERGVCPFFDMICRKLDGQRSPSLLMREYSVVRGICKSAAALSMFPFASCKACRIKPRS